MIVSRRIAAALFAGCAWMSGCAVGPEYQRRTPEELGMPAAFSAPFAELGEGQHKGEPPEVAEPSSAWWSNYNDPRLDRLILDVDAANPELAIAESRLRRALALRGVADSLGRPTVTGDAVYSRERLSGNGPRGGAFDLEDDVYRAGVTAAWEIDLFGRISRRTEGAQARVEAELESYRAVQLALYAEVVGTYAELRGVQGRLSVAERNVAIQEEGLRLAENKFDAGLAPAIDVAQASTVLSQTRALIPTLQARAEAAVFRLGVLTGRAPLELREELLVPAPLPHPPDLIATGLPADLLERRPDLRRAERIVAAEIADVSAATADLYPSVSLFGSLGLESVELADFADADSRFFGIGPGVIVPILNGGRLRAQRDAEWADADAALDRYRATVLTALEEVERSLSNYRETQREQRELERGASHAAESVRLARELYDRGLRDFQVVLDAQSRLAEIDDQLADARTRVVGASVDLYQALGGGWDVTSIDAPDASAASIRRTASHGP